MLKDWHYFMISSLALIVGGVQIVCSVFDNDEGNSNFYIGRLMAPVFQLCFLILSVVASTKACMMIDKDILEKE